ncbi:hypothetical protein J6590_056131 [Homalodisca vitripennis]|nr:hypothetical protein J6590_056131 [Homalodisca vitripennis]
MNKNEENITNSVCTEKSEKNEHERCYMTERESRHKRLAPAAAGPTHAVCRQHRDIGPATNALPDLRLAKAITEYRWSDISYPPPLDTSISLRNISIRRSSSSSSPIRSKRLGWRLQ